MVAKARLKLASCAGLSMPRWQSLPWVLAVALLCLTLSLWSGGEAVAVLLEYDRSRILAGQTWRLLTGNAVHVSTAHVVSNAAGLLLIAVTAARLRVAVPFVLPVVCALAVGGGLLVLAPDVAGYRGLSGMLCGLLAFVLGRAAIGGDRAATGLLVGFGALLLVQAVSGRGLLPGLDVDVIVEAHALGALAGVAALPWAVHARRLRDGSIRLVERAHLVSPLRR